MCESHHMTCSFSPQGLVLYSKYFEISEGKLYKATHECVCLCYKKDKIHCFY